MQWDLKFKFTKVFLLSIVDHPNNVWDPDFFFMRCNFLWRFSLTSRWWRRWRRSRAARFRLVSFAFCFALSIWRTSFLCFVLSLSKQVFCGLPRVVPSLNPSCLNVLTVEWAQVACLDISRRVKRFLSPCLVIFICLDVGGWIHVRALKELESPKLIN